VVKFDQWSNLTSLEFDHLVKIAKYRNQADLTTWEFDQWENLTSLEFDHFLFDQWSNLTTGQV
jgi:hypothetical protein